MSLSTLLICLLKVATSYYNCNDEALVDLSIIIDGEIFTDADTSNTLYSRLSQQWNAKFNDLRPNAIIMAESASDISLILTELIIPCNLDFSVRSAHLGGHLWSGYSVLNDGIVIDLSRLNTMKKPTAEPERKLILLEPGVTQFWGNQFTKPYLEIFPTSGDCNQFSFGGFLQGGGLSLFLRSAGLGADYIERAEIVLMNGEIVIATKNNEYKDLLFGIKGGGAGNFGIVTKYLLSTFTPHVQVISFEVYWLLSSFESKHKLKKFIKAWSDTQNGDNYKEFTGWFILMKNEDNEYHFRLLGIWNGDIEQGYKFWNDVFLVECQCEINITPNKGNVFTTNAWNAVEIHQTTFGGQGQFNGVSDARNVKEEWTHNIISNMVDIMLSHLNDDEFSYIWLLVAYGGKMLSNDPNNKHTSFGNRDAVGDITIFITSNDANEEDEIMKLTEISSNFLDKISPFYYPNHPLSIQPINNIPVAFYDCINKPNLYKRLVTIKKKYDPNNLLNNPVTINVNQQCPS